MLLILAAHSTELVKDAKEPVVIFMPEGSRTHLGGTMRLGLRPTLFQSGTEKWSVVRKLIWWRIRNSRTSSSSL